MTAYKGLTEVVERVASSGPSKNCEELQLVPLSEKKSDGVK
jgi:hypothetical protein